MIKKISRIILFIISPFILMILVNEIARKTVKDEVYKRNGITAINSSTIFKNKCSWQCHNNTSYCINHHVKSPAFLVKKIKPIYFGIIALLGATASYGLANILFLVVLWPCLIFLLIFKILDNRKRLIQLK